MADPNAIPGDMPQEPSLPGMPEADPLLNPFAGNQPIVQEPGRLGLGGNILSQAGVFIPSAKTEPRKEGEAYNDAQEAAKKACGLIAGMFVTEGDPDSIVFPVCDNMDVINQSLKQLENTALGIGYGAFPATVLRAWTRFTDETTEHYRKSNNLELADLVPLKIEVPKWLEGNPDFDILPNCKLMDIEIDGDVNSVIAKGAQNCRITFNGVTYQKAQVCDRAKRCTVIFKSDVFAERSFQQAENMSVRILGKQAGTLGTMTASRVECNGTFSGWFNAKGASVAGQGVRYNPM